MQVFTVNQTNGEKELLASFDPASLEFLPEATAGDNSCTYRLINGCLVPFSFTCRLHDVIAKMELTHHKTYSLEQLCGFKFWNSLTENERAVAGHCILWVINYGLEYQHPDTALDSQCDCPECRSERDL